MIHRWRSLAGPSVPVRFAVAALATLMLMVYTFRLLPSGAQFADMENPYHVYATPRQWFLVVDFDCLKRLGTGVDCVGPLRVAVSQLPDEPNQLDVQFLVADRPSADHIMLHAMLGSGNDNVSMRALPRVLADVPADLAAFRRAWRKSAFLRCRGMNIERPDVERLIPLSSVSVLSDYRRFADAWNTTFLLACGTLLGWYRECSLIKHTQDVDLTVSSAALRPAFMAALQRRFDVQRVFGLTNTSLELNWVHADVSTDLWFRYAHNSTHERIGSLEFVSRRQLFSYYPTVRRVCAGVMHGVLVYVPCNVEQMLEVEYGNWTRDIPLSNYSYFANPANIEPGPRMGRVNFLRLQREKWP